MSKRSKYVRPGRFNWALIPILGVLGIVPLIVRIYTFDPHMEDLSFIIAGDESDFFLAWKCYVFSAIVFAMACVIVYKLCREGKKIDFHKIFIPLGIYAFLAFLSAVFSEYQPLPFTGSRDQFESVFALMGYAVAAYYAFLFVETENDLKLILGALTFSAVVMLLIGVSQALYTDFYQTSFGKNLILDAEHRVKAKEIIFNFEKGRVYMSLYNPNYVGSYVSFLFPIYLMLALNKWKFRILMIPACLAVGMGLILALLGSQSRAGFVGVIMSLVLLLVVMNKKIFKYIVPVAFVFFVLAGFVVKMNADADNYYLNRLLSIFDKSEYTEPNFSDVSAEGNLLKITYCGNVLGIEFDYDPATGEYAFMLSDGDGNPVPAETVGEGNIIPTDERFSALTIRAVGLEMYRTAGFGVTIDGKEWYFMNTSDGVQMLSGQLKPAKIESSETFEPLREHGRFASNRGFIWSKTIPLLKDNVIIGSGPDTMIYEYPNEDYRASYYGGYENVFISKPHNMYLQIGVQTGVISLICILVFYFWYFVIAISTYTRVRKFDLFGLAGTGIFVGSFGYMLTQMINDSSITVAPIFWTMMGVGVALVLKTRKQLKEQIAEEKNKSVMDMAEQDKAENSKEAAKNSKEVAKNNTEAAKNSTEVVKNNTETEGSTGVEKIETASEGVVNNGNNKHGRKGSASRKGRRAHR